MLENLSDEEILSLTIIGEARGEPIEGQVAVGCVIRNRLHNRPEKYHSFKDVCLEPEQFSCWNTKDNNHPFLLELAANMIQAIPINDPYLRQCMWVARGIITWAINDNTKGARFYLTTKLFNDDRPTWAKVIKNDPVAHGNQVFFEV